MIMEPRLLLAQDLCARLCHDLVGPLGTMAAALDMLDDDPEAAGLARDASASLRAKLQFWRAAAGAGTGPMLPAELVLLLEGVLAGGRATADVTGLPASRVFPAPVAQLLLVAIMLAGEALPRGGLVHVSSLLPGVSMKLGVAREAGVALKPEGRGMVWPPGVALVLGGGVAEGPRAVLAPMLAHLAVSAGWHAALREEILELRPA
jgi:histidine phosphotransferase ChpT